MARKTFISYKYDESRGLRDRILKALGDDAIYYMGERSDSPDLTDASTEKIKQYLSDMMFGTSVTIVILSPNMRESKWIPWEVEYSLKSITRKDRTSHINGVVGVIAKIDGGYSWLKKSGINCHNKSTVSYDMDMLPNIVSGNHFNSNPAIWHCNQCKTYDFVNGSYITFVEEDEFLSNPSLYIENAYTKSENDALGYDITKTR